MHDELLSPGPHRSWLPAWARILLVVLLLVAAGGYAIVRAGRHSRPAGAGGPTSSAASSFSGPPASPSRPWPRASGACGSDVALPIVSAAPLTTHTGVRVMVGGSGLRTVDLDSGRVTAVPGVALAGGESVTELAVSGSDSYALTSVCRTGYPARAIQVSGDRWASVVATGRFDDLLAADQRVWALTYPSDDTTPVLLDPLTREAAPLRRLPNSVFVYSSAGTLLMASRPSATGSGPDAGPMVLLLDAQTGAVLADLGSGYPLAADAGEIIWSDACQYATACTLHRRALPAGADRQYRLPLGRSPSSSAVISPDGRLLAFWLQRTAADPRYNPGHPQPPSDMALLHLDTGQLQIVPNLELAPKAPAALAFSADGRWLVIALNEAVRTRLLVWQPGLDRPMQSRAQLPGRLADAPPVLVLPGRG